MMEHCPICDKAQRAVLYCKRSAERCGLRGGTLMTISGEAAAGYNAVRLDNFQNANRGELVSADDVTGIVVYKDTPTSQKTVTLGDHAIRIMKK